MTAKRLMEAQYSELCARLGDIVYKMNQLSVEKADIEVQLKELNRQLPQMQRLEQILSVSKKDSNNDQESQKQAQGNNVGAGS